MLFSAPRAPLSYIYLINTLSFVLKEKEEKVVYFLLHLLFFRFHIPAVWPDVSTTMSLNYCETGPKLPNMWTLLDTTVTLLSRPIETYNKATVTLKFTQ